MGRIGRGLIVGLVTAFALAGTPAAPARAASEPDRDAAATLLLLINADRAAAGVAPLVPSIPATTIAEAWSQHMIDIGDLAHNDDWFSSESKRRLGAGAVGENVATNIDLADAHRRLMASPGHRANILDARFHHVGIGVVRGPTGAFWITEDFLQIKDVPAAATSTVTPQPAPPPPRPSAGKTPPPPPAAPPPVATAAAAPPAHPAPTAPPQPQVVEELPQPVDPARAAIDDGPIGLPGELAAPARGLLLLPDGPARTVPFVLVLGAAALLIRNVVRLRHLRR
ncbi:MAG TPA: CAP domain-containing protein [Acidimicrobiales bacterium]|jgi:hypothetical protein|nr:CAP domain-containing protein [Acidimicrobiales bacterium]